MLQWLQSTSGIVHGGKDGESDSVGAQNTHHRNLEKTSAQTDYARRTTAVLVMSCTFSPQTIAAMFVWPSRIPRKD